MKKMLGLALALTLMLSVCIAMAENSGISFSAFPSMEEILANDGQDQLYGPNRAEGHMMNKFRGYYQKETDDAVISYYTTAQSLSGDPVLVAALASGQDVEAFLTEYKAFADDKNVSLIAIAPKNGYQEKGVEMIADVVSTLSPSANIYNYYAPGVRTLLGYGDGAAAIMRYVTSVDANGQAGAANVSSVVLFAPEGYEFDEAADGIKTVLPIRLVAAEANEDEKAFMNVWERNNGGENAAIVASTDKLADGLDLVAAFRRNGNVVQQYLPVVAKDDPAYQGMSLYTTVVDGTVRYYYVYVSEAARASGEKKPVFLVLHGKNAATIDYIYRSGWLQVAENEDIVVVFPISSPDISVHAKGVQYACAWGRWDDTRFLQDFVVPEVLANDNGDPARVYVFGQSSGCCMALAQAISAGDNGNPFAAISGNGGWLGYWEPLGFAADSLAMDTAGTWFIPRKENGDGVYTMYEQNDRVDETLRVPTMLFYGTEDQRMNWAMLTDKEQPGGFTMRNPGILRMFDYYMKHYELEGSLGEAIERAEAWRDGVYSNFIFYNAEHQPMIRYTIVDGMGHSHTTDVSRQAFNYLKNFVRAEDGTISFTGDMGNTGDTNVVDLDPDGITRK